MTRGKVLTRMRFLHEELRDSMFRQERARSTEAKLACLRQLLEAFPYLEAKNASMRYRLEAREHTCDLCYGETDPIYFFKLLKRLRHVQGHMQRPQELILYDLGAGCGKLLFAAALAFNFDKVVGLEVVSPLHDIFRRIRAQWEEQTIPNIGHKQLIEKKRAVDVRFRVVDFLDDEQWVKGGSVFLINASGLGPDTLKELEGQMEQLPGGCLAIMVGRRLQSNAWVLIGTDKGVPSSYGPVTVFCLEKRGSQMLH